MCCYFLFAPATVQTQRERERTNDEETNEQRTNKRAANQTLRRQFYNWNFFAAASAKKNTRLTCQRQQLSVDEFVSRAAAMNNFVLFSACSCFDMRLPFFTLRAWKLNEAYISSWEDVRMRDWWERELERVKSGSRHRATPTQHSLQLFLIYYGFAFVPVFRVYWTSLIISHCCCCQCSIMVHLERRNVVAVVLFVGVVGGCSRPGLHFDQTAALCTKTLLTVLRHFLAIVQQSSRHFLFVAWVSWGDIRSVSCQLKLSVNTLKLTGKVCKLL